MYSVDGEDLEIYNFIVELSERVTVLNFDTLILLVHLVISVVKSNIDNLY